jgi:hypothetical protein
MPNLTTVKAMAKALRAALAERGVTTTHSDCLDLVSRQHGHTNWNTFRPLIEGGSGKGPALRLPLGWISSGLRSERYRMGIDVQNARAALIESIGNGDDPGAFGTLMQSIVAERFVGQKVRLRASLRTRDVVGSAVIWFRVDGERGRVLRFDNLEQRKADGALSGSNDWTARSIVLDVPQEALSLHYGFFLKGSGRVWARDFSIDAAEPDAEATPWRPYLDGPTNLDFSRGTGLSG